MVVNRCVGRSNPCTAEAAAVHINAEALLAFPELLVFPEILARSRGVVLFGSGAPP
jgi:hypothetical protein